MDEKKIRRAASLIIEAIGEDPKREGLKDTPERYARSFHKIFEGYGKDPKDLITTFDGEKFDEMILCRNIEFFSTCEHHLLPFFGKAHVAYIPGDSIIGLSKIPRLVDVFARRLQNQERLTSQIADTLEEILHPKGVAVVISAKHFCISARGVEKKSPIMETSSLRGLFKGDAKTRSEFFQMISR